MHAVFVKVHLKLAVAVENIDYVVISYDGKLKSSRRFADIVSKVRNGDFVRRGGAAVADRDAQTVFLPTAAFKHYRLCARSNANARDGVGTLIYHLRK